MRILICTEETPSIQSSVWLGVEMARKLNAETTFLTVVDEVDEDLRESLRDTRRWLRKELELDAWVATTQGFSVSQVVSLQQFDVILFEGLDVQRAVEILPQAPPPQILFVRPGCEASLKRILLCTDSTHGSHPSVDLAARLARAMGAEVTLMHVDNAEPDEGALAEQEDHLAKQGVLAGFRRGHGRLQEEVARAHEEQSYDLTVLSLDSGWGESPEIQELMGSVEGSFLLVRKTRAATLLERFQSWVSNVLTA